MKKTFQDLGIVGLANERCFGIQGPIVRVYLQLSMSPPLGWSYMFCNVWQSVSYPNKQPVGIDADAIWIECAPEEVLQYHLPHLGDAVAQTNAQYISSMQRKLAARENQKELDQQTRAHLDELGRSFNRSAFSGAAKNEKKSLLARLVESIRLKFIRGSDISRDSL